LVAARIGAIGELRSLRSKKTIAAEKRPETNISSHKEKEQSIEYYVDRETAVASKHVDNAEAAIGQGQEDMGTAENAGFTTREAKNMFE